MLKFLASLSVLQKLEKAREGIVKSNPEKSTGRTSSKSAILNCVSAFSSD